MPLQATELKKSVAAKGENDQNWSVKWPEVGQHG
jgi:hypothetical protein